MSPSKTNKANAQHSTGPKTEAGKQRSSLNALRHGLTGQIIVLPSDDLEAYQQHIQHFVAEYRPKGATENQLVQSLADAAWRQNRVCALENNLLTLGVIHQPTPLENVTDHVNTALAIAASLDSQTRALANLSIHGQRLARQFEKTLALLGELQTKRIAQETCELDQAANLVKWHRKNKKPYHPSQDGFVFSDAEIDAFIRRQDRTQRAFHAKGYCFGDNLSPYMSSIAERKSETMAIA
jgi:hypothetical protein